MKHVIYNIRSRDVIGTPTTFIYTTDAACECIDFITLEKQTTG